MTTKEQILKVCEYASGEHSTKVLCAMVNALPREQILETSHDVQGIDRVLDIVSYLDRNKKNDLTPLSAPLYRPVKSVLSDFNIGNNKAICRKELQTRLLYMTASDKMHVISTFLQGCKTDRIWTLKHLYKHWDPRFMKAIECLFEAFLETESAKIICRYDTPDYIRKHLEGLHTAGCYLNARLRLSADEPIDRNLLNGHWDYLVLLAHFDLPITQQEARNELITQIRYELENLDPILSPNYDSIMELPHMRQMVWALGRLKMVEVLFELLELDWNSQHLFKARDYSTVLEILRE